MKRWHWIAIALLPLMVAAILVASPRLGGGTERAQAQQGLTLALDMDITDGGPCADIDASATHAVGDPAYGVGICIGGMTAALGSFEVNVTYDDTLNAVTDVACATTCLDSNPDANAGSTIWGTSLGSGWDCSGLGFAPPVGDKEALTGAGNGRAFIGCYNNLGPFTFGDNETSGTLAVITFHVTHGGPSPDNLDFGSVVVGDSGSLPLGSCNPHITDDPITACTGATDSKSGSSAPTNTPTAAPTVTKTPCPEGICPPTPKAWTKTPTPVPTGTPEPTTPPSEPTSPPPPPPPPPSGGGLPQVVPPATGEGSSATPWTGTAVWVLVAAGMLSLSLGGLCVRRARNR